MTWCDEQATCCCVLAACSNTFKLNCLLVFHKSYTFGLAAVVRGAMLWFGGVALFADLTTVGEFASTGMTC